jgi:hypothetical protein
VNGRLRLGARGADFFYACVLWEGTRRVVGVAVAVSPPLPPAEKQAKNKRKTSLRTLQLGAYQKEGCRDADSRGPCTKDRRKGSFSSMAGQAPRTRDLREHWARWIRKLGVTPVGLSRTESHVCPRVCLFGFRDRGISKAYQ